MAGTVLGVSTRALLDACAALGADADAIARRAGVDRRALVDPDARLRREQIVAVWREGYEATRDPALALHAAERAPDGAYPVLDYLGAASATLGEALERISRYFVLLGDIALRIEPRDRDARVILESTIAGLPLPLPAQEYTLAALILRTRRRCGIEWTPSAIELAAPGPFSSEHTRVLGVAPRASHRAALVVSHADWDRRCRGADPELAALIEVHARSVVAGLARGGETSRAVAAVVTRALECGEPSLADLARKLGTSARTLQRRLDAEGTTLATIVRSERERIAKEHLSRHDVSLAELAYLLGFSDQSAFTRAFRRWTGTTPARFRRGLR